MRQRSVTAPALLAENPAAELASFALLPSSKGEVMTSRTHSPARLLALGLVTAFAIVEIKPASTVQQAVTNAKKLVDQAKS